MRGRTLKSQPLIFQRKALGSSGNNRGVFEMNQDPLSSEQDNRRESKRDQTRKQMRHLFPCLATHDGRRSYCRDLTPQSNFISLCSQWRSHHSGSVSNGISWNIATSVSLSTSAG